MKRTITYLFLLLSFILVSPAEALAASLSVSPSSGTFNKGCNFNLNILLNTAGAKTAGTDAVLIYDVSRFEATAITPGSLYSDYSYQNIDTEHGKVYVSGVSSLDSGYTGSGTFANISFTVKSTAQVGASQIKFDFDTNDKTKTSDSNVIEQADTVNDVLSSVTNGTFTVGTGICTAGTTKPQGATGSATVVPSPTPDTLPEAGSLNLTATLAIMGSILTVLGLLGLALL